MASKQSFVGALKRLFYWENEQNNETEQKASATSSIIAWHTQGQPVWTPRDYASLAKEGFMQNAIAYRCVRMIAETAASVPLKFLVNSQELTDHPLIALLNKPSPTECAADLFEAWYGYLLVSGNAYLEVVQINDALRELHVLRPDRMKVIPGSDGWPVAYEYTVGSQSVQFHQDVENGVPPILHLALFHPTNDHYGLSPIEAAAIGIDIHNAAGGWNKALLDNAARPSGALVYNMRDGNLTQDQFERLKSELEQNFQGSKNAGRPLLLEGGLDWKSMSLSPRDMDFIEAKHVAAREIALAFGVPPMLLGIPGDNTYSNYAEANRSFWRQTILPLVSRSTKAIANWLAPSFSEDVDIKPDLEKIEALASEREAVWERVRRSDFLTLNEKRAAVGYGPVENGDVLLTRVNERS
ncbi:MAG: phage portal protein [Pseudomonadota bacterium]